MSVDNYLAIWKDDDGMFRAYERSASENVSPAPTTPANRRGLPAFHATTIEEAITQAQDYRPCEYGYTFINLKQAAV